MHRRSRAPRLGRLSKVRRLDGDQAVEVVEVENDPVADCDDALIGGSRRRGAVGLRVMQCNRVPSRLNGADPAYEMVIYTDPHLDVEGSLQNGVLKRRSQAWIRQSHGLLGNQCDRTYF